MKSVLLVILLGAAFLTGYYYGHRPDSPDIFGKAHTIYRHVSNAGQQIAAAINDKTFEARDSISQRDD